MGSISIKRAATSSSISAIQKRALVVKTTLSGEEVFTLKYPQESEAYAKAKIKYSPTNLAIAPNGDIYVGDGYGSSYINQYNNKGEFIRTFGGKGKESGQLDCPHGLTVDLRGSHPMLLSPIEQRAPAIFHDGRQAHQFSSRAPISHVTLASAKACSSSPI